MSIFVQASVFLMLAKVHSELKDSCIWTICICMFVYSYYSLGKTEAWCPSQQGEHPCA